MYQEIDGALAISVNDWIDAGLSRRQFHYDSSNGDLEILRRGLYGNALIGVNSIKRRDRLEKIEAAYGKIATKRRHMYFYVEIDTAARAFYTSHQTGAGKALLPERIRELTNQASILEGLKRGLNAQREARARVGGKVKMGEFWKLAVEFYLTQLDEYPCKAITNARSLERVFKGYVADSYTSLLHGNEGNDAARKVSVPMENLFLALWRNNNKPFHTEVLALYEDFVSGVTDFYDKETGEIYKPTDFSHKGRAMEVSAATVWGVLKNAVNEAAIYADRNGNFDYQNRKRIKHNRKNGRYSLSKISMDDVALSRKAKVGNKSIFVYKYIAVDVVSGYYFRPAYIIGKPTIDTIIESFRYMFIELMMNNMPMPGELEVEYALMKDIEWLGELFPFVRFCKSSTEKRAEHNIRSLKYGAAHKNGHTRGRWYSTNEAWKSIRFKKHGDFVEPTYDPHTIIMDDLNDIQEHNNAPHRLQKTYPGMSKKDVFLKSVNPSLKPIEAFYLYRYIGNKTECTIYNNDYVKAANTEFELKDLSCIKRLRPNTFKVEAYWLPEADGAVKSCYLYQGDTFIGEAIERSQFAYNECAYERNEEDAANMLHQQKRAAKQDKGVKDRKASIPTIGMQSKSDTEEYDAIIPEDITIGKQPVDMTEDNDDELLDLDPDMFINAGKGSI